MKVYEFYEIYSLIFLTFFKKKKKSSICLVSKTLLLYKKGRDTGRRI